MDEIVFKCADGCGTQMWFTEAYSERLGKAYVYMTKNGKHVGDMFIGEDDAEALLAWLTDLLKGGICTP